MPILEDKTPAEKAADTIKNHVNISLRKFVADYKRAFDMVWNPSGASTQDILDAFGSDAADLFMKSAATRDYILSLMPTLLPENYHSPSQLVTINPDGTVTIAV